MAFVTTLSRTDGDYTLTVGSPNPIGDVAVTVAAVVRRDRFMEVETLRVAPGTAAQLRSALPDSLIRVIVWVNLPFPHGSLPSAVVRLSQELGAGEILNTGILEDTMFVFDIVP
jgi:hypothetical protein